MTMPIFETHNADYFILFKNMPDGFVYFKTITNQNSNPVDYMFLEVNEAFEHLTGLKKEYILRKRFSEVIPDSTKGESWINKLSITIHAGKSLQFVHYFKSLHKLYSISLCSDKPQYWAAIFHEITETKILENKLTTLSDAPIKYLKAHSSQIATAFLHRNTEQALQESEEQYRRLVEQSPNAVFICLDGKCIYTNVSGIKLLGAKTIQEILGKSFLDFVHPQFSEITIHKLQPTSINEHEIPIFQGKFVRMDNIIIDVEVKSIPFMLHGKPAVQIIVSDITLQKKTEKEYKESEYRLRQITDNMLDIICQTDAKGIYEYVSPSCINILGYKPEEMIGKSIFDFLHLDDMSMVAKAVQKSIRTLTCGKEQFRYRHADGHYIWLESFGNLLFDNNHQVIGATFSNRDITKRKLVEEKWHMSEVRYWHLINVIPDAIFVHDGEEIIFCNKSSAILLGINNPKDLIGTPVLNYIPLERKEIAFNTFSDLSNEKTTVMDIGKLRRHDGTIIDFEIVSTTFDYEGKTLILEILRDITERIRFEELKKNVEESNKLLNETLEYDKLKTEFFANISHELRTPLNVIFGALQLLESCQNTSLFSTEKSKSNKYTSIMKQNCYRLMKLINNLIDITKIDSNFLDIHLENHNIVSIVENITLSVAEYIENKGITLNFDTDIEEKIIACDPDKIERIMLNLLSNAFKFTKSGGFIMVKVQDKENKIFISVKDTGIGIPMDKLDVIFQRFRQIDKSLTRDYEGSGIGLSLVESLVQMHDGNITVTSEYSKGSEFIIELPIKVLPQQTTIPSKQSNTCNSYVERISIEFSDIYS